MGDPQLTDPVDPRHGHQRQGLDGADDHAPADGARPHRRHVHEPAPRADQRTHHPQRRADQRRGLRRADRRRRRPRGASPVCARPTSRRSPPPRSAGSPTSPSTSPSSRSGCSAAGTRPTSSTPQVAVVTNIGLDHTEFAGPTLADIAAREGGHHQARQRRLSSARPTQTWSTIFDAEGGASRLDRGEDFDVVDNQLAVGGRSVDLRTPTTVYPDVFVPLHGAHQGDNAAVALAAVEAFFAAPLPRDVVTEGFADVEMPGRFEVIGSPAAGDHRRRPQPARRRHLRAGVLRRLPPGGAADPRGRARCATRTRCSPRCAPTSSTSSSPARRRRRAACRRPTSPPRRARLGCDEVVRADTVDRRLQAGDAPRRRRRRDPRHRLALRRRRGTPLRARAAHCR